MIAARKASLKYRDLGNEVYAVHSIDLEIVGGEFLGILGPSGSGKSSLLYLLSGLKTPSEGDVLLDGASLVTRSDSERAETRLREFGFIFQYPYLLGYLSALENVVVARPDGDFIDHARDLLSALGLDQKSHRYPHELSGGERQRVCIARALLGRPKAIFADEPTASLDHANGVHVVELLAKHRGDGALIMVTHDPTMLTHADRVVRIEDGKLVETESESHPL